MIQCAFTNKQVIHLQSWQIVFSHSHRLFWDIGNWCKTQNCIDSMAWSLILTTMIMTANLRLPRLFLYWILKLASQVHEELVQVIKDAEEGLLHLKRARLLSEADTVLHSTNIFSEEKVEPLDPADVEPDPPEEKCFSVGSKCRFRYKNGCWYNGQVVQLDNSMAKISFLTPTSENMMVCKIILGQVYLFFLLYCRLNVDFSILFYIFN